MKEKMINKLKEALNDVTDKQIWADGSVEYYTLFTRSTLESGGMADIFQLKRDFDLLPDTDAIIAIPELIRVFQNKMKEIEEMDIPEDKKYDIYTLLISLRRTLGIDRREKLISKKGKNSAPVSVKAKGKNSAQRV